MIKRNVLAHRYLGSLLLVLAVLMFPSATSWAQECLPAADGLISWWPGDANATDVESGNDGTLQGASFDAGFVTSGTAESFYLDGVDDYVSVAPAGNLGMTSAYTVEAWVESSGPSNSYRVIAIRGSGQSDDIEFYVQRTSNDLVVAHNRGNGGAFDFVGFQDPPAGSFFHLAVTFDGAEVHAYYDGVDAATTQRDRSLPAPLHTGTGWEIGRTTHTEFTFAVANFQGRLDELAVYDRALSAGEVEAIVAAGSSGKCKDEDGDGYRPPADCDETNAAINPDGLELPGNFVDENCDGNLGDCDPCATWKNHGHYVRCVSHAVESMVMAGALTESDGDALVSSSAQSSIGKKGFVPPECQ